MAEAIERSVDGAGPHHRRPARRVAHHDREDVAPTRSRSTCGRSSQAAIDVRGRPPTAKGVRVRRGRSTAEPILVLRRRRPPAAGRLEPALERDQVHADGRARRRRRSTHGRRRVPCVRVCDTGCGIAAGLPAARLRALPSGRRQPSRGAPAASASGSRSSGSSSSMHGGSVAASSAGEGQGAIVHGHAAAAARRPRGRDHRGDAGGPRARAPRRRPHPARRGRRRHAQRDDARAVERRRRRRDRRLRRRGDAASSRRTRSTRSSATSGCPARTASRSCAARGRRWRRAACRPSPLSAFARKRDKQRARDVGFDGHLAKPIDPVELLRTLT